MKPLPFEYNDNNMSFNYIRTREGPNQFVCYYKHQAVLRQDPKDAWRVMGAAKFTDTGKLLKHWCLDMHQKWVIDRQDREEEGRKDTSFASDVQQEVEPNDNTKMVT
jgi:hypothetical protein